MTRRPIGYYVHHHGAGHAARARAIADASDWPVVLLGTGIGDDGIDLSDDQPQPARGDATAELPAALHYAPYDHDGIRARVARIATWIEDARPALMVVDVSVEVAMLARLASVPTVYVRLNGDRSDAPHLEAFRGATALIAPFHCYLELASTPAWVREKTRYLPGIAASQWLDAPVVRRVLVVAGRGGAPLEGAHLAGAARACPDWDWRAIGPVSVPLDLPVNLTICGWVDDAKREIAQASVVVGAAGDGLVGAVLAADRPFVCIPEDRPFDEQRATARRLGDFGAAVVLPGWPRVEHWPALLDAALALPADARRRLHDPDGAATTAAWLAAMAQAATENLEISA